MMNQRNKKSNFGGVDTRAGASSKNSAQRRAINMVRGDQIQSGKRFGGYQSNSPNQRASSKGAQLPMGVGAAN